MSTETDVSGAAERRDPRELLEVCPAIFDGLTDEEVEDRLDYYRLRGVPDPFEGLEEILKDRRNREPVQTMALEHIRMIYQYLLRAECCKSGRERVADEADERAYQILDSLARGRTRGEQRAALLLRHPEALVPPPFKPSKEAEARGGAVHEPDFDHGPPDARKIDKLSLNPFRAVQLVNRHAHLQKKMEPHIPKHLEDRLADKKHLQRKLSGLSDALKAELDDPADVRDMPPGRAARVLHAEALGISVGALDERLTEARRVLASVDDMSGCARQWAESQNRDRG